MKSKTLIFIISAVVLLIVSTLLFTGLFADKNKQLNQLVENLRTDNKINSSDTNLNKCDLRLHTLGNIVTYNHKPTPECDAIKDIDVPNEIWNVSGEEWKVESDGIFFSKSIIENSEVVYVFENDHTLNGVMFISENGKPPFRKNSFSLLPEQIELNRIIKSLKNSDCSCNTSSYLYSGRTDQIGDVTCHYLNNPIQMYNNKTHELQVYDCVSFDYYCEPILFKLYYKGCLEQEGTTIPISNEVPDSIIALPTDFI